MIIFNFSLVSLFIMKMMYYYDIVYRFFYKPTPIKIEKKDPIKEYPKKWTKYVIMKNNYRVAHLYDPNLEETNEQLKYYNEFET